MTAGRPTRSKPAGRPKSFTAPLLTLPLIIIPVLYLLTLARTLVLGDPTEFTFVANILGIAHPPGYAFITVLGKLFQTLVPIGTIPWRMHLLSATVATLAGLFVYGTVRAVGLDSSPAFSPVLARIGALLAALTVGSSADLWQHAIHANPHIITATFLAANLFFLSKWWAEAGGTNSGAAGDGQMGVITAPSSAELGRPNRWLYLFCLSAGLGVTQHPLTVFSFPAYAIFILWVQPSLIRQWRRLVVMLALALLGLTVWLYFPIRSPMEPAFGPSTMNSVDGFLDHVLARGLSESLPFYSLREQPNRAIVFGSLLRLQYSVPIILTALFGGVWLSTGRRRPLFVLFSLAFLCNYAFVISLRAQDIMAYLLGPFLVVGLMAGIGLLGLFELLQRRRKSGKRMVFTVAIGFFLLGPALQVVRNLPHISLRDYSEGEDYVAAVFSTFEDEGRGAVLLNDWEHMTPLWYTRFVDGRWPDESDVRPELVSAARSWLDNVYDYLPGGPVYLSNFRRDVVDAGFRLRPEGPFFQVVEPGEDSMPETLVPVDMAGGEVEVVGYLMPEMRVKAGDFVPLSLAMRAPQGSDDYYVPVLRTGGLTFPFTTDSHLVSPSWEPGEIIIERFDFALPHDLEAGDYPLTLTLRNLNLDQESEPNISLGNLQVEGQKSPPQTDHLLANFRQRVGLMSATAAGNGRRARAPWSEPIGVDSGDLIQVTLKWESVAPAEESYTVFLHLIDLANHPVVDGLDYTPLGGASPTHLWIPKWLPGQRMLDPYRLQVPEGLAPGRYLIEVGLYEMVGRRRLQIVDEHGNQVGDRYLLGELLVGGE